MKDAPSIRPKRTPPTMPDPSIAFGPFLATMTAPAPAPDMMEFQASSFCRK